MPRHRAPDKSDYEKSVSRRAGLSIVTGHPALAPLAAATEWHERSRGNLCPPSGWAVVTSMGTVHLNPDRDGTAAQWAWAAAHCLLHLGFGHAGWRADADRAWQLACCLAVSRFAAHLGVGEPPARIAVPAQYEQVAAASRSEESCAARLRELGADLDLRWAGPGGGDGDMLATSGAEPAAGGKPGRSAADLQAQWAELLAAGLAQVAGRAVEDISGVRRADKTDWQRALDWFASSYPLIGAIADAFRLVEDAELCRVHDIRVAAISAGTAELYVNPLQLLTSGERQFVIGHELLHAALRHDTRAGARDHFLWNVACDYVINGWLAEMGVGDLPEFVLHDQSLRGLSAEEVYDRIVTDRRRLRKIATLRGIGVPDVLPRPLPGAGDPVTGVDLDEFYRRSMTDGLAAWQAAGRGTLPAGLVEEIRALSHPPVPWDVELARWFDHRFPPQERRRSYARASRRQSATPDIPRPGWRQSDEAAAQRTFGVVLDTSGSMDTRLLGKALGAIASYAVARDVTTVRVIFCDAAAHDNGWMHPADIAGRVSVRGRGGTVLQPGVTMLAEAPDFPPDGPVLIITDGYCDSIRVPRDHAYLIPDGAVLPFRPAGPVFRFS